MANAFSSLLGIGGGATNRIGNALTGFSTAIERGLEDPRDRFAREQAEAAAQSQKDAAEEARQQAQFKYVQNSAAFLDSLTPDLQKGYLDLNGPALVEQGILDEEDLPILYQNIGIPGGFTGLARSAIDPNQQQQNAFEGQKITETGRSNRATEALRGGELDVSRGNLAVSQDRLAEDARQFDATRAAKLDGGDQKQQALNTWLTARNGLIQALRETETGPIRGRLPAFTADQQTAEGAVAATAPVLKQIFRVAGEGVFTDRDQALLLDMVPKRTDRPEARIAKIRNIDAIINAKLGITTEVSPTPLPAEPEGQATPLTFEGAKERRYQEWKARQQQ